MNTDIDIRTFAILSSGSLVLVEESIGTRRFGLVGGEPEVGETLEDSIRREFMRRFGIEVEAERLIYVAERLRPGDGTGHEVGFYFAVKTSEPPEELDGRISLDSRSRLRIVDPEDPQWEIESEALREALIRDLSMGFRRGIRYIIEKM